MDTTNVSLGAAVCRICMCGETSIPYLGKQAGEPLISPCRCSGTMGLYHRSCLEHWLTLTKTKNCEICKFVFKIAQKSRSFTEYIRMRGYKKRRNDTMNRNPFVDLMFVFLTTPLATVAMYLCVRGATLAGHKYHAAFENRSNDENGANLEIRNSTSMEFALFVFVAVVLFFVYIVFIIVMIVNHMSQFKKWQKKNKILFVVDQLDSEQSMHFNPNYSAYRHSTFFNKLKRIWKDPRSTVSNSEIARSEAIPIEPVVGIAPSILMNFNQTSPDSENTHNHDSSRNAIPFVVRSPDQFCLVRSSTPQMYSEVLPRSMALSPIGLEDLYTCSTSNVMIPYSSSKNELQKSQSVYSVCSFGNGVVSCSTPVSDRNTRIDRQPTYDVSFSTFKPPAGQFSEVNLDDEHDVISKKGRFSVERLDTPR